MFASEFQLKIFYPNRDKDQPFSATLVEKTGSRTEFTLRRFMSMGRLGKISHKKVSQLHKKFKAPFCS